MYGRFAAARDEWDRLQHPSSLFNFLLGGWGNGCDVKSMTSENFLSSTGCFSFYVASRAYLHFSSTSFLPSLGAPTFYNSFQLKEASILVTISWR
jgi:hypothetical protein